MALEKRGKYWFGNDHLDIRHAIIRYSKINEYNTEHFADAQCTCGNATFRLMVDDCEGAAVRCCSKCGLEHPIGDSGQFLENADLELCECPCGKEEFEVTAGVSLFEKSESVRWVYLGCRCVECGITAVYGDWKNEYEGYHKYLTQI